MSAKSKRMKARGARLGKAAGDSRTPRRCRAGRAPLVFRTVAVLRNSCLRKPSQIQRKSKFRVALQGLKPSRTGGVPLAKEACQSAALRFISVDRKGGVTQSPRMRDVIGAAPNAAPIPGIYNIK